VKQSAGILVYKTQGGRVTVFLVHPGGPYWAGKDAGAWSIPKGEFASGEDPLAAARREFREETGQAIAGDFVPLQPVRQAGGKTVHAWAVAGDVDAGRIRSNMCEIEWPPRSGRRMTVPEVDRAQWFPLDEARRRINKGQVALLDELARRVATES
jgi:predicted NUDIX family NTP pyrophosphohydrolase